MTAPVRLQLSRRKGFDLQALSRATNGLPAISVARPTQWGNQWKIGDVVQRFSKETIVETFEVKDNTIAVMCFRRSLRDALAHPTGRIVRATIVEHLAGKNLACWCALDAPCHADVLLELANR